MQHIYYLSIYIYYIHIYIICIKWPLNSIWWIAQGASPVSVNMFVRWRKLSCSVKQQL